MIDWLQGKKTYIIVFVGVVYNTLVGLGVIGTEWLEVINTILGFFGLGALRDGIRKAESK